MKPERVLVAVPAYNEAANIAKVLEDLAQHAGQYDLVVIDDGSTDDTGRIVRAAGETLIDVPAHLGYGKVVHLGLRYMLARGYDAIVFFDGDCQHRAQDVPRLVEALRTEGVDLVIGSRFLAGGTYSGSVGRRVAQTVFSWLTRPLIGKRVFDTTSGLKALSARSAMVRIARNG